MSVGPLVFELITVLCIAVFLLHHYGQTLKQHPIVTIATLTAWYFSLLIVFVLPLDVSSTFYRQCLMHETDLPSSSQHNPPDSAVTTSNASWELNGNSALSHVTDPLSDDKTCQKPWSFITGNTLPALWQIVYWTSQILTWLVLPFMQSYSCAGDFTALGKVKRAVIENAVYYGSYLFIFVTLLVYAVISPTITVNIAQIKVIVITAANTWGLFLLVLLLGYGLVEIPRGVWRAADFKYSLAQTYFKLAKLSTEKQEASESLEDVLEETKRVASVVRYNHPQRKHVDIIISKCPRNFQSCVSTGLDDYEDYDHITSTAPDDHVLVRLHRNVISAVHTQNRTSVQWDVLMKRSLHLENIEKNAQAIDRKWKEEYSQKGNSRPWWKLICTPTLSWLWFCAIQPKLRKVLAVCLAITSLMVIWSECTFFNESPVLSLFAIFINLAVSHHEYFYVELASCLIISYMCVCAYYTVFRIKFFNYYYIAGHHQTDESSLLFVGIMLCRLTTPLCLNFLGMIHLDNAQTAGVETSYTQIMGSLVVISVISDGFNIYFPILVCVLCTATYFSLGQRCLSAIGFQRFIDAADDLTSDLVDEGRQLVNREKRRLQRELNAAKRAEWRNEFGQNESMRGRPKKVERGSSSLVRFDKMKEDEVELLGDVGSAGYSSVADDDEDDGADTVWEKSSRWKTPFHNKQYSNKSTRPPNNIFNDL